VRSFYSTAVLLALLSSLSQAAITISGDFQGGTTTPTVTITEDFTFTVLESGYMAGIRILNWVNSDGSMNQIGDQGSTIQFKIDGGVTQSIDIVFLADNGLLGPSNPNDGVLGFSMCDVVEGQSITFLGGQSFTFNANLSFNGELPATFTGQVQLMSNEATPLSDPITIPEPSSLLLGALGAFGLMRRRR
jgi:hypothetical protein